MKLDFLYENLLRPALFKLDAEKAHGLSIAGLKSGLAPKFRSNTFDRLKVELAGLSFPNPLGMAAGYDKNADVPQALLNLGFGHVEIGTVTPKPQPGNEKPRIFRLPADQGVINRLGFNSAGHDAVREKLQSHGSFDGIVGINIGANKLSDDFAADYVEGIHAFGKLARYFTINISSPNTPGLRALQGADPLADLLRRVCAARVEVLGENSSVPIFLKIAPDLTEREMDEIATAIAGSDIDALIVSNTTLSRAGLQDLKNRDEAGGLSGRPLFQRATIVLAKMHQRVGPKLPLIGVGGVHDAASAFEKLEAGATLVQLYSAMVYEGPTLPRTILEGINARMEREGLENLSSVTGRKAADWAERSLDDL